VKAFAELIAAKVEVGLKRSTDLPGSGRGEGLQRFYHRYKRFVRKLKVAQPQRVWRMELGPARKCRSTWIGSPHLGREWPAT